MKIISKWPQAVTFAEIDDTAINATLDLNATSSRGLPVSFAVTKGASFTTISNGRATFSAIGEVTIEASQDGNSTVCNHNVAVAPYI